MKNAPALFVATSAFFEGTMAYSWLLALGTRSVDSAQVRAAEAEARLRDYGAESGSRRVAPLPSALDAFGEV
jgi:hypothetical protein